MTPGLAGDALRFVALDAAAFLRDHWQKKPLLIRNPWMSWANPLKPDELAGLACEDGVEARLITQKRKTWSVEHGPFAGKRFAKLGDKRWTLLVQAVDQVVPAVAALIEPFRFVPNWRVDDVMVSYATDGGGVGAHFDQYDVFLVQGLGQRRWRVGGACDATSPLLPHDDLRLLASFEPTDEWILDPGDVLYVPPGIAHDGVAVGGNCMTYSIGFRAPSRSELIAHWCDHLLAQTGDDDRYADPDLALQANPGEIPAAAIASLHAMITDRLVDRDAFARWFGEYNSTSKYPDVDVSPKTPVRAKTVRDRIAAGTVVHRSPRSRFAFIEQTAGVLLFVDGESFACAGDRAIIARVLCARDAATIDPDVMQSDEAVDLIVRLVNKGSVAFERKR